MQRSGIGVMCITHEYFALMRDSHCCPCISGDEHQFESRSAGMTIGAGLTAAATPDATSSMADNNGGVPEVNPAVVRSVGPVSEPWRLPS
jgi:hypothetical protein